MPNKRRYNPPSKPNKRRTAVAPRVMEPEERPAPREKAPPVQYGNPFIVLEARDKSTFIFSSGAWVPYAMSIAECRQSCQVKTLPQEVNGRIRYEVRNPISDDN